MRIEGEKLSAVVDPRRGAKITSLVDSAGNEWLSQGRGGEVAPGAAFIQAEMSGWDECAPTIVACRVADWELPDHGDLWDAEFALDGSAVSVVARSLPYRFERSIIATPSGLRLQYTAEALSEPVPFLWAAHPQFSAPPGTRVELAPTVAVVVDVLAATTPRLPWSVELQTIDTVGIGECRKVYVEPETTVDGARLVHPDGSALGMRWSDACRYLGIWFDNGAYSPVPVIALEPSTGYFDALDRAIGLGRAAVLEPERPLTWWVELDALAT